MQRLIYKFDRGIGRSQSDNIFLAEIDKARLLMNSIMEEAISSSIIEGASTTRVKAKEMIRMERKPCNRSEKMIINNYEAMREIVGQKHEALTIERILLIHTLMTRDTLDNNENEGRFRRNNEVFVVKHSNGEIVHIPPPTDEIQSLMKALCHFFNKDTSPFSHPIVKACILHFMMGWIHPFVDGNGRTARALFYWYMLQKGYWLTEYLSISLIIQNSKSQYEKAYLYTENDEQDMGYFLFYHLHLIEKAFAALIDYSNKKQK